MPWNYVSREKCYTARQLYNMFEDNKNYLYLIFLEGTLKDFSRINKLFELADVVQLGTDLMNFFFSLLQRIVVPAELEEVNRRDLFCYNLEGDLMPESCAHLGYAFISNPKHLKIPQQDVAEVKKRCFAFLVKAVTQVQMRLTQNAAGELCFRNLPQLALSLYLYLIPMPKWSASSLKWTISRIRWEKGCPVLLSMRWFGLKEVFTGGKRNATTSQ